MPAVDAAFSSAASFETPMRAMDDRAADGRGPSVIGATLVMRGELTLDENLIVHGTFDGPSIKGVRHLSVGTFGQLRASIYSESAEIAGSVEGMLKSETCVLFRRTASLSGSFSARRLIVEDGTNLTDAVLSGRITRA